MCNLFHIAQQLRAASSAWAVSGGAGWSAAAQATQCVVCVHCVCAVSMLHGRFFPGIVTVGAFARGIVSGCFYCTASSLYCGLIAALGAGGKN